MSVLHFLLLLILLAQPSAAKRQTLISVAGQFGTRATGAWGDGASSYFSLLSNPRSIAFDSAGNIFIADWFNYRIKKVDTAGIMTTYAGTGTRGYSGDGGPATAAMTHNINQLVCDPDGNLYFTDEGVGDGGGVRMVNTAGIISTVASGIHYPLGLGIDSKGNLFVANSGSGDQPVSKLYKLTKSAGWSVTVVAGGGNTLGDGFDAQGCKLSQPHGITVDAADNIFIADTNGHRIRRIDAVTNIITTIAGNGQGGVGVDGILATSAAVSSPKSVSVDAAGNVYIATATGVRVVNVTTGLISTIVGASDGGSYPQTELGLNPQDPQWQQVEGFVDAKVVGNLLYVVSWAQNAVSVHFLDSIFTVPVPKTCNYTVMGQRDLVGALLRRASVTSEAACQSLCCRTPSCQGYAFTPLPAEADYASAHRHAAELWRRVSDQPWAWHTSCAVFTNVTHSLYSSSLQSGVLSTLL
jgi:sugar lactone lactonase YvrE